MIDDAGKVTVRRNNFGSMWVDVDLGGVVGFGSYSNLDGSARLIIW